MTANLTDGRWRTPRPLPIALLVVAATLAGCAPKNSRPQQAQEMTIALAPSPDAVDERRVPPPLVRSQKVIDAKIARKQSKPKQNPQHPAGLALERYTDRADQNGEFSIQWLLDAKSHIDQMPELKLQARDPAADDAGLWQWEWLGPGNIGGRIRTILIDPAQPQNMWVGSVSGGIWRTTNRGGSWEPVDDFLPSLAVVTLVMDPGNSNVMYAGTGEGFFGNRFVPGAGVFKSTDYGNTWSRLASTVGWDYVNRLAHHPTQSNVLYAGVRSPNTVFKSEDGGQTWTDVLRMFGGVRDVKVDPFDGEHLIVADTRDVFQSRDGGRTWNEISTGFPNRVPTNPGRTEIAFGPRNFIYLSLNRNGGEIWRSTDNGANWALRNTGTNYHVGASDQGWYDNAIWVAPDNSNVVVVGGIDLWRSTDGGATLNRISDWALYHLGWSAHADQHTIVASPGYGSGSPTNRQVFFGNDGGIQTTANVLTVTPSTGWVNQANNLGVTQFYGGAASPSGNIIIGGAQDNDTLLYLPNANPNTWYQAETGDGGYCAVNYNNPDIVYAEFVNLEIEKNTRAGMGPYTNVINGLGDAQDPNNARFIAPFSMDPNDPDILVAGGSSIWRTTNGASSWSSIRPRLIGRPLCSAIDIDDGNSNRIWVGYDDGTVSRTNASVTSWTDVTHPAMPVGILVTDIAINPNDSNQVFVTFGGYQVDSVWYTADNGVTWQQRIGSGAHTLPTIQVNTVRFHPSSLVWVYIGTDLGIFASEDRGLTWSKTPRFPENEGPVNVEVRELFWQGNEYLIAATYGRGMYRTRPLIVVYVDAAHTGCETGSIVCPFNTVLEGYDAAGHGTTISIKSGSYNEVITLEKRMMIATPTGTVVIGE